MNGLAFGDLGDAISMPDKPRQALERRHCLRWFAAIVLSATATSATAVACELPPVASLPASSAHWGPQDVAFFDGPLFCKHRHKFHLTSIQSRAALDTVESAMRVVLAISVLARDGPPFPTFVRPPPVSPEGWRDLNEPANSVPFASAHGAKMVPPVRDGPSKFSNFRVQGPASLCVDVEYNARRTTAAKFVQTMRFERNDAGQWLFTGRLGPDCAPSATRPRE